MNKKICIGIPCYQNVSYETLDDYMRFAFYLGRRYAEYDFFLAIKGKSEQFRARNAIIESALQYDCDYIFMLDDDHVIDISQSLEPSENYEFLRKLIKHLEDNPKIGIAGALYFQRGGDCSPVIMSKRDDKYFFLTHAEVTGGMQKVDVTGGGCMLIRKEIFDKIESPWFEPESVGFGTDIQICKKTAEKGYEIWCDTSIEIGHVKTEREIITSANLKYEIQRSKKQEEKLGKTARPVPVNINNYKHLQKYRRDIEEYTELTSRELEETASVYDEIFFPKFNSDDTLTYYKYIGIPQIARNFCFHSRQEIAVCDMGILNMFSMNGNKSYGLDFGCGTAPVGFELAKQGNKVDFYDISDTALEFMKWRCKKYNIDAAFIIKEKYDWMLLLDVIEHIPIKEFIFLMKRLAEKLKPSGSIITNYFTKLESSNIEHINMNKQMVKDIFIENKIFPVNIYRWIKDAAGINTNTDH